MSNPPVLSVVDYASWEKGYMPPSEHILIDALSYRGAKIALSSDNGDGKGAFWFVIRDKRPSRKAMRAIMEMLLTCFEDEPEEPTPNTRDIRADTEE